MPTKSPAQHRFMAAVASGSIKKPGLSKEKAREFISHGYPGKKKKKKRKGLADMLTKGK